MKKRMKRANGLNARFAIIMGDDELDQDKVTLRHLDGGEQEMLPVSEAAAMVAKRFKEA